MAFTFTIDPARDVVVVVGSGVFTDEELVIAVREGYGDPKFQPDQRCFIDVSAVTDWEVSSELLASMAETRKFSAKSRTAIFVTSSHGFGMSRMYQAWVRVGQVEIFTDRATALEWLNEGVPPEKRLV